MAHHPDDHPRYGLRGFDVMATSPDGTPLCDLPDGCGVCCLLDGQRSTETRRQWGDRLWRQMIAHEMRRPEP